MNIVILLILAAVIVFAVVTIVRRKKNGSACCGGGGEKVKAVKAQRLAGDDLRELELPVGGMTCENCARRVQNALNAIPGVQAKVSIGTKTAKIRCRADVTEEALRQAVREAGYVLLRAPEQK